MSSTPSDNGTIDSPDHPGAWAVDNAPVAPPPSLAGDGIPPAYSELPASEPTGTNGCTPGLGTLVISGVDGISGVQPQRPREQPSPTTDSSVSTNAVAANDLHGTTQAAGVSLSQSTAPVPYRSLFDPPEQNSHQKTGVRSNDAAPVPHKSIFGPDEQNTDNKTTVPVDSKTPISGGLITSAPMPEPAPTTSARGWDSAGFFSIEEPATSLDSEPKTCWQWFKGWKVWMACGTCCELTCMCAEACSESDFIMCALLV